MATVVSSRSLPHLTHLIHTCPIIDNHAHNILRPDQLKAANLLTIATEASGDALEDSVTSLSHIRAARQLRKLYGLPADADWDSICKKRIELLDTNGGEELFRKCFEGTQTVLVDDGLDSGANIRPYSWLDQYTISHCQRIVRIEALAADILSSLYQQAKLPTGAALVDREACDDAWLAFVTAFEEAVSAALTDEEVVGFKSVICYRSGLDITTGRAADVHEDGFRSFRKHLLPGASSKKFRVDAKGVNDALVISTCRLIAAHNERHNRLKPLQFHTGLGDNDISLVYSNPAYLQPLIEAFPTVPIVLLHSSYPYTREAGYLATTYKNVYLDIGEVFPMLSRDGQVKMFRQALELTPWSKLLWSTDGHHFPETYFLANIQGREAIEKVLVDYVEQDDLTIAQAMQAAKDILFNNSNALYGLRLIFPNEDDLLAEKHAPGQQKREGYLGLSDKGLSLPKLKGSYDGTSLSLFLSKFPDTQYVYVQWLDYLGIIRSRCMPIKAFEQLVKSCAGFSISVGNLGTLQNDTMTSVCNPVGQILVKPDLYSLRISAPIENIRRRKMNRPTATVMARFTNESGQPLSLCGRNELQRLAELFQQDHGIVFLVGFEIEVTFCRSRPGGSTAPFEPLDTNHAWGTLTDQQYTESLPLLFNISDSLREIGVEIQHMHSEAGAGQYEFVLPPLPPILAVDTLIQAKQCIQQVAASRGLRATFHPTAFPGAGTAAHAHISFNLAQGSQTNAGQVEHLSLSFMASVLSHLPALCAFTMPQAASYGRVIDDSWTGGTWVAWGTQNREVPLRRIDGTVPRWEVRCLDGMANMYLALSAILAIGLQGIRTGATLKLKDCRNNPTELSDLQKQELGITTRLPTSLEQALEALNQDEQLQKAMNDGIVTHFHAMKIAEQAMLGRMPEEERKTWLMQRY